MKIVDIEVAVGNITISYMMTDDNTMSTDVFKLCSQEQAMPSFHQAMQSLKTDFCDICEFPDSTIERTMIRKVSFNENGPAKVLGVIITAEIGLDKSLGTIKVKTPRKFEKGWNEATMSPRCHINDMLRIALQRLISEAQSYVQGNRLQIKLFAEQLALHLETK